MQAGVEFVGGAENSALGGPSPEAQSRPETPVESLIKGLLSFPGSRVRNVLSDTYTLNGPESLSFISPELISHITFSWSIAVRKSYNSPSWASLIFYFR
jgi:hypothetical protein